jgi:PAS domain S-box-containing protein
MSCCSICRCRIRPDSPRCRSMRSGGPGCADHRAHRPATIISLPRQRCEAGAQDYLVKGQFEHDALGRAIRHALVRQRLESRLRLFEAALNSAANGIVITDVNAAIEWANPAFTAMTGMSAGGSRRPHSRTRCSSRASRTRQFYRRMWETILAGQVWSGELVNRRKDGSRLRRGADHFAGYRHATAGFSISLPSSRIFPNAR